MILLENVLIAPLQTEKTTQLPAGQYTFIVHANANKSDVTKAVKRFYGLEPVKVRVSAFPSKERQVARGRTMTKRSAGKKAIVTLGEGKTLNFNDFK